MSEGARLVQRAPAEPQRAPEPSRPVIRSAPRIQRATLRLSQAHDASEREAEHVARQVMAMPAPMQAAAPRERVSLLAARATAVPAPPQDEVSPELTAEIRARLGGGQPLPADTRGFMEPRFRADFAAVRIHTDGRAASIAARLGAAAFTYGRDIFFANGAYKPDDAKGMELLAHELTHTIQQREAVQRQVAQPFVVAERTAPKVQRGIVSRALDWIADKANYIPGFRMFTIVIGRNPINMAKVERSGENILRALIEFIPGGPKIVEALENHGVMRKGGKFIEEQFAALGDLGAAMRDALMEFIDSLGWRDIFHLGDLWDRAKRIFTVPVDKAIDFGRNLVGGIATLVKDAILKPLGRWAAAHIPKWDLLVGVFGKNPVSDEKEGRGPALIGAFMELIGQREVWDNIRKGNAIGRAWGWFQDAMKGALALVVSIPGRVIATLKSLTIFDIVTLVGAFRKIVGAFASFVGDFFRWAGTTVLHLLEIVFSVVAPAVVPYLKKAGRAFSTIIKAPGRFISTLVKAGKQGFNQFKLKILVYLRDALFKWLLGSSDGAGIYMPKGFAPLELLKLGLSVLGLTWQHIRVKLVAATNETTVKALETGFDLVRTLVKEGPAAAWEQLLKTLSGLKAMVVDAALDFVKGEVVKIAIEKLVSFLTPATAFIQAIVSIYRTITFIVRKLAEIGRLVAAFIDGLAALAAGIVTTAANKVENVLASGLSLAISFLANFAGLGNVPRKVMDIIRKIRAPVDKALDAVVKWIVAQAQKVGKILLGRENKPVPPADKETPTDGELGKKVTFSAGNEGHRLWIDRRGESAEVMLASTQKRLVVHLQQFRGDSGNLDEPGKSDVKNAIAIAMPLARSIEENAKKAAKKLIGMADRDVLDKRIEADEETLRPHLKIILDTLGVRVPDQIQPALTCTFVKGPDLDMGEYRRQLANQQSAINAMSVEIWLGRRMQYAQFKQRARDEGKTGRAVTGRDPRSGAAQKAANTAARELIVQRLTLPENDTGPTAGLIARDGFAQGIVTAIFGKFSATARRNGLAESTARREAEPYLAHVAALHEPDQVVGGRFDQIRGLGLSDVNSDIGANWGGMSFAGLARVHLANKLEADVKAYMRKLKINRAFWRKSKMNVLLK